MAQQAEETNDIPPRNARRKQRKNSRLSSSSMNSFQSSTPDVNKTPLLPISITIRNLFPPLVASTTNTHSNNNNADHDEISERQENNNIPSLSSKISSLMVEDRCTLVATDVLLRIRLEILIKGSSSSSSSSNNDESTTTVPEILLYSSEKLNYTAHPRWDHLNEQMLLLDESGESYSDDDDLIANLHARFVAIRHRDSDTPTTVENDDILLAEVSLHPSNLRRLPAKDDNNDDDDPISSGKNTVTIPDSLPPNAILFHYADGYTRVMPSLYGLLLQKGIITENIELDPIIRGSEQEDEGDNNEQDSDKEDEKITSVFEDDAFDALDIPSDRVGSDHVKRNAVDSSDDMDIDGKACAQPTSSKGHTNNNDDDEGPTTNGLDNETMDTRSTLTEETDSHDAMDTHRKNERGLLSPVQIHLPPIVDPLPQLLPLSLDADTEERLTANNNIDYEIEELKRLIHHERLLLEQERNKIEEETNHLNWIMEQIQQIDEESMQVMNTTGIENTALYRAEFRLEAHRIRLLKQLQSILPIRILSVNVAGNPPQYPQHQYTIASIPLPDDIHSPSVSDDQISTSIGFLCYLVSLTSKYLAITPRYKLICRFSRSAIIDDHPGGVLSVNNQPSTVYPLFRERGAVDKEQLDRGFALLVRNIECLLQMRKVEFHRGWNALAKMEKLFLHVVDGSVDC